MPRLSSDKKSGLKRKTIMFRTHDGRFVHFVTNKGQQKRK